jgi:anti-anti-sigma factor
MQASTKISGNTFEVVLKDSISFSDHDSFRRLIAEAGDSGAKSCVFDLAGLRSIDSAGLGMFMIAKDEAKKGGWAITLRSPRGPVKTIMELSKFDRLFTIQP